MYFEGIYGLKKKSSTVPLKIKLSSGHAIAL